MKQCMYRKRITHCASHYKYLRTRLPNKFESWPPTDCQRASRTHRAISIYSRNRQSQTDASAGSASARAGAAQLGRTRAGKCRAGKRLRALRMCTTAAKAFRGVSTAVNLDELLRRRCLRPASQRRARQDPGRIWPALNRAISYEGFARAAKLPVSGWVCINALGNAQGVQEQAL